MRASLILIGLGLAPFLAQAQVFKCVGPDGHTTYSQTPCPENLGTTTEIRVPAQDGPSIPPAQPGNEQQRMQAVADWAYQRYPFLNGESPAANDAAINEALSLRNAAIAAGNDPAEALLAAIKQVGPKYASQEIVRRNTAAAEIMQQGSSDSAGGIRLAGVGASTGCEVTAFKPFDKKRSNAIGTAIPNTNLVNVHSVNESTIRCAEVEVMCGGGWGRLISPSKLQATFSDGMAATSKSKGEDVRVSSGESAKIKACFGAREAEISNITIR